MISNVQQQLNKLVSKRIWVISDLQQSTADQADHMFRTAIEDIQSLQLKIDQIWYLGDAVQGDDGSELQKNVDVQVHQLRNMGIPVRFVLGNHDLDYFRLRTFDSHVNETHVFFRHAVQQQLNWRTTARLEDFYFVEDLGDVVVFFLSDHASVEGKWLTTNGNVYGNSENYPYTHEHVAQLRSQIEGIRKPVIIASHYAFAGGARPIQLYDALLPLPSNVMLHLYGHCHIGDAHHGKEHRFRKISTVDHQRTPQINVSSLENRRGDCIRSVVLETYTRNRYGVYFRDHERAMWEDFYLSAPV